MKWRRYKIWDIADLFYQEYPEDDVSCFLQSGRPVFTKVPINVQLSINLEALDLLNNTRYQELKERTLYGGVDCAEGSQSGDRHCFTIVTGKH